MRGLWYSKWIESLTVICTSTVNSTLMLVIPFHLYSHITAAKQTMTAPYTHLAKAISDQYSPLYSSNGYTGQGSFDDFSNWLQLFENKRGMTLTTQN